jgi:hypothetical protein
MLFMKHQYNVMVYHAFAYDPCCLLGGMGEYIDSYPTFEAAKAGLFPRRYDLDIAQVVVEHEGSLVIVATRCIADDGEHEAWNLLRPELLV